MAQFNVHEAKSNLSQLLDMVERGEEVFLARHGKPVARLVRVESRKNIVGIGLGDPNYIGGHLTDEQAIAPMEQEELELWYGADDE